MAYSTLCNGARVEYTVNNAGEVKVAGEHVANVVKAGNRWNAEMIDGKARAFEQPTRDTAIKECLLRYSRVVAGGDQA